MCQQDCKITFTAAISGDRVCPRKVAEFDVNHDVTRTSARSFLAQAFKLNDPLPAYLNLLRDSDGLIIIPNTAMQIRRREVKSLRKLCFHADLAV